MGNTPGTSLPPPGPSDSVRALVVDDDADIRLVVMTAAADSAPPMRAPLLARVGGRYLPTPFDMETVIHGCRAGHAPDRRTAAAAAAPAEPDARRPAPVHAVASVADTGAGG